MTKYRVFFNVHLGVWIIFILFLMNMIIYFQTTSYDFINFDDNVYVTENPYVKRGLSLESISWAFTAKHAANWHPVTWLSHMLDVTLFGMNPGMHHFINVIFHMLNCFLLYFIFNRMSKNPFQSAFLAVLFAVHPLHVESVAWIAERKDVLSSFFWMLTIWTYIRYVERSNLKFYLLTLFFFALGLMSKPMLVTLPFVLILLDYWPLKRFNQKDGVFADLTGGIKNIIIMEKTPLLIMSIASCFVTFIVQRHGGAVSAINEYSLNLRIANAITSYIGYLYKIFWPFHLSMFYPLSMKIVLWKTISASIILIFVTFFAFFCIKRSPYVLVGWFWYLGTLVPVIGLVQVGSQAMADRYTYIPSIGAFTIIAWGIPDFLSKYQFKFSKLILPASILSISLVILSLFQTRTWSNSIALFSNAINNTDNNYVAHNNLGSALLAQGRIKEAIEQCELALVNHPYPERPYTSLGYAFFLQHDFDEAIKNYKIALKYNPVFFKAYNNMGIAFAAKGQYDEAIQFYLNALKLAPNISEIYNNLGVAFAAKAENDDAVKYFLLAVKYDPTYAEAYNNLGLVLARKGNIGKARWCFQEALRLKPGYFEPQKNLKKIELDLRKK